MDFMSQALQKDPEDIQRQDIVDYIKSKQIRILNLCYIGSDSRLKTISYSASNLSYVDSVLSRGERTASVFLHQDIKSEGVYMVPRYSSAFLDPFSKNPTLNVLCSCLNRHGQPFSAAPSTVLSAAVTDLEKSTGLTLLAGGELEYFLLYPDTHDLFVTLRKHYQDSSPFAVWQDVQNEALCIIDSLGIPVKYAHAESGKMPYGESLMAEQHEIEFPATPIHEAADAIIVSKWVLNNLAKSYGISVSFSPIIEYEKPGNGMHFHLRLLKQGKDVSTDGQNNLSTEAKKMIGGILALSRSISAFGNPLPTSYLRLAAKKDSPHGICWSERSRKALIRIPMTWHSIKGSTPTTTEESSSRDFDGAQTIEFRAADGSTSVHLLLAALTVAANYGQRNKESLSIAKRLHIADRDISGQNTESLPQSCRESSEELDKHRSHYERANVFPPELIDSVITELKSYDEEDILRDPFENKENMSSFLQKYIHRSAFSFY
jgi:glutamine synthetase